MRITFLGTGDAGGVPLYGCNCAACLRAHADQKLHRKQCSALIEDGNTRILLDAGLTDLTERFAPGYLSAILLTHFHPDHVQGLFHLRWGRGASIPVYSPPDSEGCADLYKHPGLLEFIKIYKFEAFRVGSLTITPLPLCHSKVTYGYAIENAEGARFAYLTDTAGLPPATAAFLLAWQADGVALDCSYPPRKEASRHHNDWNLALATIQQIAPERAWLTHLSHAVDEWLMVNDRHQHQDQDQQIGDAQRKNAINAAIPATINTKTSDTLPSETENSALSPVQLLPEHIQLAYDGCVLEISAHQCRLSKGCT